MRRAQLQLFEELKRRHRLVGQLRVTTAGMDGPALMGLATVYIIVFAEGRSMCTAGGAALSEGRYFVSTNVETLMAGRV